MGAGRGWKGREATARNAPNRWREPGARRRETVMNWFVLTDLEGVVGAERWDQTYADGPFRPETMAQLAREVNAAVEGIREVDSVAEVHVWDGHGPGGLNREDLHPPAVYLR